jgi:hypothetical protein
MLVTAGDGRTHPRVIGVDEGRPARVWASIDTLAEREGVLPSVRHACIACAVAAVGRLVAGRDGGPREPVFVTDPCTDELQELQFMLGEGPCMDALSGGRAVLAADLSSAGSQRRWPAFAPAAMQRGVRAVFSFPIQRGAIRFRVLGVYRLLIGPLSRIETADALLCADVALTLALDDRAVSPAG